jgi:hypothetical protein
MNVIHELVYRAKLVLVNLYGPPTLDEEHDPIVQLKRDHEQELREEQARSEDGT